MKALKEIMLIFLATVLILVIGIMYGYEQIENPYEISERVLVLSQPFEGNIDRDFLEALPAK